MSAQSPSVAPPLPKIMTFQICAPTEHDIHGSKLDHYEEYEREWRAKEDAEVDIKEEIRFFMLSKS